MKLIKKIIITILITISAMLVPTFAQADNFCCNCSICYLEGNIAVHTTMTGILHASRKDTKAWLKSTPKKGETYHVELDAIRLPGYEGWSGVTQPGMMCFGHYFWENQGNGLHFIKALIDVDEKNKDYDEQLLGYLAYKSIENNEHTSIPKYKSQMRKWIHDNYARKYGGRHQNDTNLTLDYNTKEATDYAKAITNEVFETNSTDGPGAKQHIEEKNGKMFIGPYNLKTVFGTLKEAEITTKENKKYKTTKCSTDGKTVKDMSTIKEYKGDNFYIVVEGNSVESVEKIILRKVGKVISSRVVLLEPGGYAGQNIEVYGGIEEEKKMELELPGVPYSYFKYRKVDQDTKKPLSNVGFIAYNKELGYVKDGTPATFVNDINGATIYRTDKDGYLTVRNIDKKGTYEIYEVINPNFGYEEVSISNPIKIDEITINNVGQMFEKVINNKRLYIKLSGYAWEDKQSQKQSIRNDLWRQDENDQNDERLANIKVRLKRQDGTLIDERTTGIITNTAGNQEAGAYLFGDYQRDPSANKIKIEDLNGAYIEFEYNGMCYQTVKVNSNTDNGNKSTDNVPRQAFDQNYSTVINNQAQNNGNNTFPLRYESKEHKSTLLYGGRYIYGYEGQKFPISGVDSQYIINANTKDASPDKFLGQKISKSEIYSKGIEEIPNINLGVYERTMPDLAVMEDVEKVKVTLNGYEHTYKYAQRFENDVIKEDGFNVSVKFGEKYGNASYTREIYSSDVVYNKTDENGKLQVYLTYKVKIRNESTNVYTVANDLINYFDARYDINKITDSEGNNINYQVDSNYNNNGLKKVIINTNTKLNPQTQKDITIEYKLQNEAINSVLNGEMTLNSLTEVNKYTSYKDANFTGKYGGVDKDSNPGSVDVANPETFEDDTDKAPAFILKTINTRVIEGSIWEDSAVSSWLNNRNPYLKQRIGDGIYNNEENVVENVKVELLIPLPEGGYEVSKLYQFDKETKQEKPVADAIANTGKDGKYRFEGVLPGNYMLRFTYKDESKIFDKDGNEISKVEIEKYKSTIFRNGNTNDEGLYWYRGETNDSARWSDARDITGIYEEGVYENIRQDIVEQRTKEEEITYKTANDKSKLKAIEADSHRFEIKLDYDVNLDNISEYGANLKFIFDNMDFGIIRRPVQKIDLRKEISYVKVTLANGQVLIEGDPRNERLAHVKYLPNGMVYLEIDTELIQGSTLKLNYEIIANNKESEIDYNDKNYYYYGIVPKDYKGWKVATITRLNDYLSDGLNYNPEENGDDWQAVDRLTKNPEEAVNDGYVLLNSDIVANGYMSQEAFNIAKKYNRVLQTRNFADMKPGTEKSTPLTVSRLLANTEDAYAYDNEIEVITLNGRKIDDSTPGNYVPAEGPYEQDDDIVNITITGPTGENKNILPYIMIGITSLAILVSGIIFIKKKILKK